MGWNGCSSNCALRLFKKNKGFIAVRKKKMQPNVHFNLKIHTYMFAISHLLSLVISKTVSSRYCLPRNTFLGFGEFFFLVSFCGISLISLVCFFPYGFLCF